MYDLLCYIKWKLEPWSLRLEIFQAYFTSAEDFVWANYVTTLPHHFKYVAMESMFAG